MGQWQRGREQRRMLFGISINKYEPKALCDLVLKNTYPVLGLIKPLHKRENAARESHGQAKSKENLTSCRIALKAVVYDGSDARANQPVRKWH